MKQIKVIEKCYRRALKKAVKQGFRRIVYMNVVVEYLMSDGVGIVADDDKEENKEIVYIIVSILMDIEKVCRLMDKEGIGTSTIKLMKDACQW